MFVRIEYADGAARVMECRDVLITKDGDDQLIFTLYPDKLSRNYVVQKKEGNAVYFMNNEGKTIDSYRWAD